MNRFHNRMVACLLALLVATGPAFAVLAPEEMLDDPELENRARAISLEVRCLVCQNQSIDDSDAPLARDLRLLIRERLVAGESDSEVLDFLVARYGEFVLLRPTVAPHTYLLWATPFLILGLGLIVLVASARRRSEVTTNDPLSEDEQRALERLMREQEADGRR